MRERIAIVGGGITGLVAAHELERLGADVKIEVYEASDRLGGKVATDRRDGCLIERGPDCFFSRKSGVMELVCELGIEDQIVQPCANEFSILVNGELRAVPRGLLAFESLAPKALLQAGFLTLEAVERAATPCTVSLAEREDISVRAFFSERFGEEFSRLIAEPLLAGTHGGSPDLLSMRALYAQFLDGTGSGAKPEDIASRSAPPTSGAPMSKNSSESARETSSTPGLSTSTFLSLRNGMGTLIEAVAESLNQTKILTRSPVSSTREIEAGAILLAIPANRAAGILNSEIPAATTLLDGIPHGSCTVVTLAYKQGDLGQPLLGTGFLVPEGEHDSISGATWSSQKWPERAPVGQALMRVFLRDCPEEPIPLARQVETLLGIDGEPIYAEAVQHRDALPQYELGHLDRMEAIDRMFKDSRIFVAGTSYRGVGLPDCIRQGREAAAKILESL